MSTSMLKFETQGVEFLKLGEVYFFRGLTFHHIGRVIGITDQEIVLDAGAVWVVVGADWKEMFQTGTVSEYAPMPGNVKGAITRVNVNDMWEWPHPIPTK